MKKSKSIDMSSIAVIGCGQWGLNLVRNFAQLRVLGAVCDADQGKAHHVSQQYQVPALTLSEILAQEDLAGIAIATPATDHVSLAMSCLQQHKHVFIEKPVALNTRDMSLLRKAAAQHQRILMGGHVLRYHPAFIVLKEMISQGVLGKILWIDACRQNFGRLCFLEKTVFWSLSPHDVSMILAITQSEPHDVQVTAQSIYTPADQGIAHLYFENHLVARIMASWIAPFKEQRLSVIGRHGTVVFNAVQAPGLLYYPHTLQEKSIHTRGQPEIIAYSEEEPLQRECQHFYESIQKGTTPHTHGDECMAVTRVLERIDQTLSQQFFSNSDHNKIQGVL